MHKAAGEDVFYEMEEALIKRILPHSIEAEQAVIGSMILDRDAILVASEILTSDDFYQSQYGVLFDAMLELYNEGKPVDLVTLQERLREKDVPPEMVVETAENEQVRLVGLSALMTTTVPSMEETIRQLHQKLPEVKIMVGGAVLTKDYAETIGADCYCKDGMASVKYAESLFS